MLVRSSLLLAPESLAESRSGVVGANGATAVTVMVAVSIEDTPESSS